MAARAATVPAKPTRVRPVAKAGSDRETSSRRAATWALARRSSAPDGGSVSRNRSVTRPHPTSRDRSAAAGGGGPPRAGGGRGAPVGPPPGGRADGELGGPAADVGHQPRTGRRVEVGG